LSSFPIPFRSAATVFLKWIHKGRCTMNLDESAGTKVPIKPRRRKCPPLRSVPVAKRSGKRGCLAGY
ncbi:MAG TPA: hypothetical protein VFC02_18740, partial [Anaerolineales bacterium]|nr:hypothetical protein [Anaerolineales bacterium]